MRFLKQPYYLGLLSTAAIHGAAHQPMEFQVVTDRPTQAACDEKGIRAPYDSIQATVSLSA